MFFQASKPVERTTFVLTVLISFLLVFLLPSNFNSLLMSYLGSSDMAGPRMALRGIVLPLCLVAIMIPVAVIARRRLRDLDLSGVLLFVFPVWPLLSLAVGPIRSVVYFPLGMPLPFFWTAEFWLGLSCMAILAITPGKTTGGPPDNALLKKLRQITDTSGRIDADAFRKQSAIYLCVYAAVAIAPLLLLKSSGMFALSGFFQLLSLWLGLVKHVVILMLVCITVRRLNDIGKSCLWAAFFPLLFLPLFASFISVLTIVFLGKGIGMSLLLGFGNLKSIAGIAGIASIGFYAWLQRRGTAVQDATVDTQLYEIEKPALVDPARKLNLAKPAFLACIILVLVALAFYQAAHPYGYLRYRMTVNVQTPEGLKTGSSIRQVNFDQGPKAYPWIVGEAVPVDLGSRGILFALIGKSEGVPDYGYTVIYDTFPMPHGAPRTKDGFDYYSKLETEPTPVKRFPMFVRFDDIDDPTTMRVVNADNLGDAFGDGVRLVDVTIEMTKDAPAPAISKILRWIDAPKGFYLAGGQAPARKIGGLAQRDRGDLDKNFLKKINSAPRDMSPDRLAQAARGGSAQAQYELGLAYDSNVRFPKDPAEAMKWYRLAADQGHQLAKRVITLPDTEHDLEVLRKSAETGMPAAQSDLCLMYALGRFVPKNLSLAFEWCKRAADKGDAWGASGAAGFYISGMGAEYLPSEGLKWLKIAAEKGDALAQLNLGYAYASGSLVEPDREESEKWYQKASENGFCPETDRWCGRKRREAFPVDGGEIEQKKSVIPGPPVTIEGLKIRDDLMYALNNPDAGKESFKSFRRYLLELPARGVTQEDFTIISLAIADNRITDFNGLGFVISTMGDASTPLAKLILSRMIEARVPEQREVIRTLDWAFSRLPTGMAKNFSAEILEIASMPQRRGLAWNTVSRLADQGPEAFKVYEDLLRLPRDGFGFSSTDERQVQLGAIVGLCRMGSDALAVKDLLVEFIHTEKKDRHPRFIEAGIATLSNFMDAESLSQEFKGEITEKDIQRFLSRNARQPCSNRE